jgi:hypothetical protein
MRERLNVSVGRSLETLSLKALAVSEDPFQSGLFGSGAVEVGPVPWHGSRLAGGPIHNG